MKHYSLLRQYLSQLSDRWRIRLSASEADVVLAALGLVTGFLAGAVILAFRLLVEGAQDALMPGSGENYGALPAHTRLLIPIAGALLIGLYFALVARKSAATGVPHVMNRVSYHQGTLPWRNGVAQFIGGSIAIISGHPVGREGPSIHLGAVTASQLAQRMHLPNNSARTLVACGSAAAIAASFNTPLAGVAFAMEVIMMDYSIAGFLPVILAAVSGTAMVQLVYGASPAFLVPVVQSTGLAQLPYVLLTGLVMGVLAAAFIRSLRYCARFARGRPFLLRMLLAGAGAGVAGVAFPEVMAVGYNTVTDAIAGRLDVGLLVALALAKLAASAFVLGLGVPAGVIGPSLFIGAVAGGALGIGAAWLTPGVVSSPAFYAVIGMGAMMGATLRAPLAALTALLELTGNPGIIFPGMLAIVVATLATREIFGLDSVFVTLLRAQGIETRRSALLQGFERVGIARVMDRRLVVLPRVVSCDRLKASLAEEPRWVLTTDSEQTMLVPVTDILKFLEQQEAVQEIDLLELPAQRLQATPIDIRATLREALVALRRSGAEALSVVQVTAPGIYRYYGVVTRQEIDSQYLPIGGQTSSSTDQV